MESKQNIGEWTAIIKKENKNFQITIDGTFPTNGEKPRFHLIKNDPQGIVSNELLLTLVFGSLATLEGKASTSVHYRDEIPTAAKYKKVLIVDENNRAIANINVDHS